MVADAAVVVAAAQQGAVAESAGTVWAVVAARQGAVAESAGAVWAVVVAAQQQVAESAGAVWASVFQRGRLEQEPVCSPGFWMLQPGGPGILSATQHPGHDGVAQKTADYNADLPGVDANKDTAAENSPSTEAAFDTTPAILENTRYRV